MRTDQNRDDSSDLLNQYLQEIAQVKPLTIEQERELARRVQQNDKAALELLVRANLRFVVSYAKRFRNSHVAFLDLINEGNIGLIQAAKKFDPDKNVKFITYAVWWIRQAILHALSEQGGAFRIPPKRANMMYRLEKMIATIHREQNRMPSNAELAKDLGVDVKEVERLLSVNNENYSLSSEVGEGSDTELVDMIEQTMIASVESELEKQSLRDELLAQMSVLTAKERLVLTLRHGLSDNLPKKLTEIAELFGSAPEEVGTSLAAAIATLCSRLELTEAELALLLLYTNPREEDAIELYLRLGDTGATLPKKTIELSRMPHLEKLRREAAVQHEIHNLPLGQRVVLELRFGILDDEEFTLRDIGEILNLSRERVRQIEARAEAKCRRTVKRGH